MTLTRTDKIRNLASALRLMAAESDVESLAHSRPPGAEASGFESLDNSPETGLKKVLAGKEAELDDEELRGLEAIIMPQERPVAFIRNGVYDDLGKPWVHLNDRAVHSRIEPLFASIGRVELPTSLRIPYGGTGFVVGPDLIMTNRHVAELFTDGLGMRHLVYHPGDAAVHFRRHRDDPDDDRQTYVEVVKVVMIHPYWDMALLQVEGLGQGTAFRLSVEPPEDLIGREIAAIGYPARDDRNDLVVQDRIFQRTYGVKRFQPGKVRRRESIRSFQTRVSAMTHDSSTLGGNSGSALVDLRTGLVVGLHFAGVYLKSNYAVPTYELARDPRVVAAGVQFAGSAPTTSDFDAAWAGADGGEAANKPTHPLPSPNSQSAPATGSMATWTLPLHITLSFGQPTLALASGSLSLPLSDASGPTADVEALKVPVIHPGLDSRAGYDPAFLQLDEAVPLPELTTAGKKAVVKLEEGGHELKYHHFSVVMHKKRRLALFTAANVDWREASRTVNGHKPSRRELTGLGKNDIEKWVTDPRIPDAHQLPDVFFTRDRGAFDKGHLVRRDDVAWGVGFDDMQKANGDTYHTTNCSPQVAPFNQSTRGVDNWGDLEDLVQQQTRAQRSCVFAGPVLDERDPIFHGRDQRGETTVQIPRKYWKILVVGEDDGPAAYGFVLEQDLSPVDLEFAAPIRWKRFMVSIASIETSLGGLLKLTWLKQHDRFESEGTQPLIEAVQR